jgi:apolipoprotein N-acyltransferase
MDKYFEQFGGTTGGYARQDERTVMIAGNSGYKIAPAICYESIYGEFLTSYIKNGANIIGIITNDGWWGNTRGHKQHLNYARLRAVETRRWVLRSANTGISCFIDPNGTIIDPQGWDKEAAIKLAIPVQANERLTFFVITGDIISKIASVTTIILLVWSISIWLRKKPERLLKLYNAKRNYI